MFAELRKVAPFGHQLLEKSAWEPQGNFGDWSHRAAALSLGESSVLKYSVTYPLRTGLEWGKKRDKVKEALEGLSEEVTYLPGPSFRGGVPKDLFTLDKTGIEEGDFFEEIFVRGSICVVSLGPLGGPSKVKGLYRPLDSYGTGGRVKSVVKTKFSRDIKVGVDIKDTYYCLVENSGMSLYADEKIESHTAYMAEFKIDRVISSEFGLLVVPILDEPSEDGDSHDSKYLYALTHPAKQVSRVWFKTPDHDFLEFDASREKLMWCEKDMCFFWEALHNSGFSIKRLVRLQKQDIAESTALNASIYYTNTEQTTSPFTPAGGSFMYSPLGGTRHSHNRSSSLRMNRDLDYREGSSLAYWPSLSLDLSQLSTHGHGLATGFYPPHYCVYDDPEFYFRPLFACRDVKATSEPQKFRVIINTPANSNGDSSDKDLVSVWFLLGKTLHVHSIDLRRGKELSFYEISGVLDFVCSNEAFGVLMVAVLTDDNNVKVLFLDERSTVYATATVVPSRTYNDLFLSSLEAFLFGDTLICGMEDSQEKLVMKFRNFRKHSLISMCVYHFSNKLPSWIITDIISRYMAGEVSETLEEEWEEFASIVKEVITSLSPKVLMHFLPVFMSAVQELSEELTVAGCLNDYVHKLSVLHKCMRAMGDAEDKDASSEKCMSVYLKFLNLISREGPLPSPEFEELPLVMKLLLKDTDSIPTLKNLSRCKTSGRNFSPVIDVLVADAFRRNNKKVQFSWPRQLIRHVERTDYVIPSKPEVSPVIRYNPFSDREDVGDDGCDWTAYVLSLRVFSEDRRVEEVCRLLDSSSPLMIDVEQKAEMSDHDFLDDQEKHLLQLMQVSFSAPVGRTGFTLRTEVKAFANLSSVISIPRLCLTGKCVRRGTTIELTDSDLANSMWPTFHNAVAATVAVRFADQPTDAWFAYNKSKTTEGAEQAGMILGFGLNGILMSMPSTLQHDYLSKENSFMSMAMLLGLSVNKVGTGDIATWKVISLHIGAMLPACTTELEIPKLASLVAPCALGILFMGTHQSHIAKVLLGEISKRYSPLSLFGGNSNNNSTVNTGPGEVNTVVEREAHSLCAGFGLGFVNLGKGRVCSSSTEEDGFDGILRRFVVGGPKPSFGQDEDDHGQLGSSLPSLWEEYRCCHIEEGDNVNVDVATPSAIVAVALTYLKSGNEAVLKWLAPPNTLHLLDCVRPDILMLRCIAYILVLEKINHVSVDWLQRRLMPRALFGNSSTSWSVLHTIDHESTHQAWTSIICGYCMGLGIRGAGTKDPATVKTVLFFITNLLRTAFPESTVNTFYPKVFVESILCSMLLALSLLQAGSGDLTTLRLLRYMQHKVSGLSLTPSSNAYGLEMCVSMSIGILFLGGGRYSLCCDDRSIAVIFASVFPKWPINASDNRYHLQALRHLYVLACQPRLLLPKPMPHSKPVFFRIEYLDGKIQAMEAPLLLPPFDLIKKVTLVDEGMFPVEFELPRDLSHLKKVVANNGIINVVRKPLSSLKYNFLELMASRESRICDKNIPNESTELRMSSEASQEFRDLNLMLDLLLSRGKEVKK